MAVTKTHPIKSTLKAAIDYICNPEKTDGKLLVSSYGCAAETADIEFSWTRCHAIDKGTNLGRHLIQAFQPGEVTPEQAHEIGMELAREILGGRYEFVLTTHIDRDHVHNHLIFNAVSFADHKHYHSNKRSYHFIRRTSDRICKEHGLSIIVPGQDKGKSYIEHQAERTGTSYKAKRRASAARLKAELRETGARIEELTLKMKHVAAYRQLKPIYDRYQASKDKEKFLRGYEREIILFEAAARECKRLGAVPLPATERMQAEMDALTARRAALTAERQKARREEQDYAAVRRNVEEFLSPPRQAPARQKDMELE